MKKRYQIVILFCFFSCYGISTTTFASTSQDFTVAQRGHILKVHVEDQKFSVDACKKLLEYAWQYLPPSWIPKVQTFVFSSPRYLKSHGYGKNVGGCYNRYLKKIILFLDLETTEPKLLFEVICHEYAHANNLYARNWPIELKSNLWARLQEADRFLSEGVLLKKNIVEKYQEYWAEVAGRALVDPSGFKKKYPKDYTLVEQAVLFTDSQNISKRFAQIDTLFEQKIKAFVSAGDARCVVKSVQEGVVTVRTQGGITKVLNINDYHYPRIYCNDAFPKNADESVAFVAPNLFSMISSKMMVGDTVFLFRDKAFLLQPVSPIRKANIKRLRMIRMHRVLLRRAIMNKDVVKARLQVVALWKLHAYVYICDCRSIQEECPVGSGFPRSELPVHPKLLESNEWLCNWAAFLRKKGIEVYALRASDAWAWLFSPYAYCSAQFCF